VIKNLCPEDFEIGCGAALSILRDIGEPTDMSGSDWSLGCEFRTLGAGTAAFGNT
jgi:hypothetical protein